MTNADPGCGLIKFNDVTIPFVDKYPQDTLTFKIMDTKPSESGPGDDMDRDFQDAYEGYLEELDPDERKWLEEHPAKDPTMGNGVVEYSLKNRKSGD